MACDDLNQPHNSSSWLFAPGTATVAIDYSVTADRTVWRGGSDSDDPVPGNLNKGRTSQYQQSGKGETSSLANPGYPSFD